MLQYIIPATGLLFTLENILWINIGVFIGSVFAAIPGLSVILCVILFLPVTYSMTAIPGMMFLLGIYCAGGYGGSVSAILINTPGTPHAAATMLDGHPLSQQGRTKVALKIALYASTFGGVFSALMLLFLGPQVAKIAAQLGTAEYFMVCVFGLTIIAGVSGKSMIKGLISACLGLLISCVGSDPMTSYDRFTFGISRLYLGLDLAICLIGLFALVEIMAKEERRLDLHSCRVLCSMGIPMGLQYSITAIGSIVLQSSVNALGSLYVAAVAAGGKVYQLLACPFDALGATMSTYCGQNVGACKLDRLGQGIRSCSVLGLGYSVIAFCAILRFAPQCALLFLDPQELDVILLTQLTTRYIVIQSAFFFPLSLVNIIRFSIQGMGFSTFAILAGVLEMAARTVVGLMLVPAFGYTAACFASPAAWVCADLFLVPASAFCIARLRRLYPNRSGETAADAQTVPLQAGAHR